MYQIRHRSGLGEGITIGCRVQGVGSTPQNSSQPLSPNLWTFLPNADEIAGKSWKIRKTIDSSLEDSGIMVSTRTLPTKTVYQEIVL